MDIGVLGQLTVLGPDGSSIAVPSGPQRRLLNVLAIHANAMVRASSLEHWLGLSPGALRTSISRLRRVVGADVLQTTPPGYTLLADVDVARFDRLVAHARTVGDDLARISLEEAVALWRGDPLDEFAHEAWAEMEVSRLHEQHATAVEDLAVVLLDAGEVSNVVVALRHLIERDPYRERTRALLMRALVAGGRRTEAMRAFQSYRELLRDEIGTDPSAALVELDRAIASLPAGAVLAEPRTGHLAWHRDGRLAGETRSGHHRHELPVPLSSFVGRRNDLATVNGLMQGHRLVTLTGAGGCGKTRLALAVAMDAAERRGIRAWWAELGLLASDVDLVEHVAVAVGLSPLPGADHEAQLMDHLSGSSPTLLLLDNAEHVIGPAARLLSSLLAGCPSLRVLVTTREPLRIDGEVVWRVPSMATPQSGVSVDVEQLMTFDAVQLFLERARTARPEFVVDAANARHIAAICIGVDGLPMAIELAAARLRTLPIEIVADGIGDAVRWQSASSSAPLARHATLHASIAWSVALVEPGARSVLHQLSIFQGSFTIDAAAAVADSSGPDTGDGSVVDAVSELVDASLLQFDPASGRYRMLYTVRQFCALRAEGTDQLDGARARHARHFASFCAEVGDGRHGIERDPFLRDMPDVVAAMEWARKNDPAPAFAMCAGLASVRSTLGYNASVVETWAWLLDLDRASAGPEWVGAWAAAVAATMAAATGNGIDVSDMVEEVRRFLPPSNDRARGWLARGVAMAPAYRGDLRPIVAHIEDAVSRRDELEVSVYGGFAAYMLAMTGHLGESAAHVAELRRLTRRHRVSFRVGTVGNGYAAAVLGSLHRGELRAALAHAADPTPEDPAFSMTAAAALAHAAVLARDGLTMQRALEWSRRGTIPLLRYLDTFIELSARLLAADVESAADLAEQYWEESAHVPVSRLHPLPLLTSALLAAGRTSAATDAADVAERLVAEMDAAPLLDAGARVSRAQIAAQLGERQRTVDLVRAVLDVSVPHRLDLLSVDAIELAAAASSDPATATALSAAAAAERKRLGYRFRTFRPLDLTARHGAATPSDPLPMVEAVALARSIDPSQAEARL